MTDNDSSTFNTDTTSTPQDRTFAPARSLCEFESFEYYSEDDVYRALLTDANTPVSTAVVSAVAAASDTDPLYMDPLYSTINPDALDTLGTPQRAADGDRHITFEFHGYEVTVSSYGSLKISPLESPESLTSADD
ncbi:HalOD1 output domain-containing protein [Halostella pelagica]|uniref:HalOD1 output domain-containing protein n=1 Tax=Halostella pelagica TaxID=2583824 RepID=UPI001386F8C6|nr:HalOD1 output domain-containing protein [Halostella pelagica]